jgi:predicted DNA-binding transcriptional regulator YafY
MSSRTERCVQLLFRLLEDGRITTVKAARWLGVDRRTARADLRLLASVAPIHTFGEGRDRSWVLDSSFPVHTLALLDRIALEMGRATTRFLDGSGLHEGLARLAPETLHNLHPRYRNNLDNKFRLQPEPYRSYAAHRESIVEVLDGLLRERELSILYHKPGGEDRLHQRLQPLTLVVYRRALYVMVRRPEDGRVFTLAIERMRSVEVLSSFGYPDDWDPDKELDRLYGFVESGEAEKVVLRFSPEVQEYVDGRVWHRSQTIRTLPDGHTELEMYAAGKELKRLVLEWGEHCEVLQPQWLREEIARTAQILAARYSSASAGAL